MLFNLNVNDPNLDAAQKQGYQDILRLSLDALEVTKQNTAAQMASVENLTKMDRDMSSIVKSMGVTTQYSQLLKQELGRAVTEVALMGGKQEDINKLQKDFIEATNRTIVLSTENVEKLFAVSQVSGVAVKTLETSFRNAGMETTHISDEMKVVYNTANSLGVNAQTVSNMVVTNLDKMNRFGFGTGVEGMAKMAAKAAAMRVDMGSTLQLAEKLFSPEAAIDVASTLQRLGATSGALLDPLKLMDLAQNNVPELQNQLAELSKTFTKFDEKTGKFQIMPEARRQLKEVSDALGIDRAEFEKMALESAKIEKKLGEIDFSGISLNIDEDQKMMLANLAEFNKGKGDYTVKFTDDSGRAVEKALSELQQGDLEKIKIQQQTLDPQKELVDVAKQQLGASNTLIAQNNALIQTIQTQYAITKSGSDFLQTSVELQTKTYEAGMKEFTLVGSKQEKNFGDELYKGLSKVSKGEMTAEEAADYAKKILTGTFETYESLNEAQAKLIRENPIGTALGSAAGNINMLSQTIGVDLNKSVQSAVELFKTFGNTLQVVGIGLGLINPTTTTQSTSNTQTATPQSTNTPPSNLNTNTNTGGTQQQQNTGGNTNSNNATSSIEKKQISIDVNINANVNDNEVKRLVVKAFEDTDTKQLINDKLVEIAGNYGLTVV